MEILGYVSAVVMGVALGLTGGGGSILTVPIFVYLFHIDPVQATSYSLLVVGLTASVGGITYSLRKETDLKTALYFALPSFLGVFLVRSILLPKLPETFLSLGSFLITKSIFIMLSFAVLMVSASVAMIRKRPLNAKVQTQRISATLFRGFLVGCITGFVGAGGGFIIVPALVILLGMEMRKAVGTSLVIISANSLIGFLSGLSHERGVAWLFLCVFSSLAMIGTLIGSQLAEHVPQPVLKKGFGFFVLLMGIFILVDHLVHF